MTRSNKVIRIPHFSHFPLNGTPWLPSNQQGLGFGVFMWFGAVSADCAVFFAQSRCLFAFSTWLKQVSPSQPILMTTAFAERLGKADNPVDAVLNKPFQLEDLRRSMAELLG